MLVSLKPLREDAMKKDMQLEHLIVRIWNQ